VRCGAPATEVDHRLRRIDGGRIEGNLQSLCHDCHAAKTSDERVRALPKTRIL
jgi:5-methylcytosine-specific restriction endonuclease McrA